MTDTESDPEAFRQLIFTEVCNCTDPSLLDLIYKMLKA